MSERIKVLVSDYAWSTLEPERDILSSIGADLIVAEDESETTFVKHAPNVDAILTNWARVSTHVIESAIKCQVIVRYGIGLDNIDVEKVSVYENNLFDYLDANNSEDLKAIVSEGLISESVEKNLENAISEFTKGFQAK